MIPNHTTSQIDDLRASARTIVRELGFMQKGLAGTALSASAVHSIVELGKGTVGTASELGALLHLEKSSVSRLVQKLQKDGLVEVARGKTDKRAHEIILTQNGRHLLGEIENYARRHLSSAMDQLAPNAVTQIETGLALFAKALSEDGQPDQSSAPKTDLHSGYRTGIIASVVDLHASFYSQNYGFGAVFERKVATELAEFMGRIDRPTNAIISAYHGETLLGSVSLDGEDLGRGACHLRWFIVGPSAKGMKIGGLLLERAMSFVDQAGFESTRLWTFKGLDAARHLYEKFGFELVYEAAGSQWGTEVIEQEFVRKRPR